MLSRCFLDCSVGVGVFVTGLSQFSSFFYELPVLIKLLEFTIEYQIFDFHYLHILLCNFPNSVSEKIVVLLNFCLYVYKSVKDPVLNIYGTN